MMTHGRVETPQNCHSFKLQTTNYKLQTANYKLQTTNYKLQTTNYKQLLHYTTLH
jgi:hypothetical protein